MIVRLEARGCEGAIKTLLEQLGDLPAEMADEDELAIAGLARNAREHLVMLRQILEQRLRAPIGGRIRPQPKFLAGDRRGPGIGQNRQNGDAPRLGGGAGNQQSVGK